MGGEGTRAGPLAWAASEVVRLVGGRAAGKSGPRQHRAAARRLGGKSNRMGSTHFNVRIHGGKSGAYQAQSKYSAHGQEAQGGRRPAGYSGNAYKAKNGSWAEATRGLATHECAKHVKRKTENGKNTGQDGAGGSWASVVGLLPRRLCAAPAGGKQW